MASLENLKPEITIACEVKWNKKKNFEIWLVILVLKFLYVRIRGSRSTYRNEKEALNS